jgi:hypothetical protein
MSAVYQVNKGVSRPIVFRGLKAQYIAYLAVGLVGLLLLFAVLYISGLGLVWLLPLVLGLGVLLFLGVFRLSRRFGEHGLMKFWAGRRLPDCLRVGSRKVFLGLKTGGRDA